MLSNPNSFMMPNLKLYSPAGLKHFPEGSGKRSFCNTCVIAYTSASDKDRHVAVFGSNSNCSTNFLDMGPLMHWNCVLKNVVNFVLCLTWSNNCRTIKLLTDLGWCLTSSGIGGIRSLLRVKTMLKGLLFLVPLSRVKASVRLSKYVNDNSA